MEETKELAEMTMGMIFPYFEIQDKEGFSSFCRLTLSGVKDDSKISLEYASYNVAAGLYPHIQLTDEGKKFFSLAIDNLETVPSWEYLRDVEYFIIEKLESAFFRSLVEINEENVVRVLLAIGIVKQNIKQELELQSGLREEYND